LPLAILAWIAVSLLILWLAGQVIHTLVMLAFAGLLAYSLAPAAKFLERVMPRTLAILLVFLIVLGALGVLLYVIAGAAVSQVIALSEYVQFLLTPGSAGQTTPFEQAWRSVGISQSQVTAARDLVVTNIEGFTGSIVPLVTGVVTAVLDIVLVAILSIYLLLDGSRLSGWLRGNMLVQQGSVSFFLDTVQRVVGGYIRSQLILCGLIGVLVGAGMQIIGVPFALLLGVLAFFLAFIPVVGTLVSGVICVQSSSWSTLSSCTCSRVMC
jgi:predicted PurR-regulated permease PerM